MQSFDRDWKIFLLDGNASCEETEKKIYRVDQFAERMRLVIDKTLLFLYLSKVCISKTFVYNPYDK